MSLHLPDLEVLSKELKRPIGTLIALAAEADGWRGRLLKDWTLATQITTGSGLPVTPLWVTPVRGVTGTMRASLTGASPDAVPASYYLNPGAYGAPAPSTWGTAGRNSISGPAQFSMNAAVIARVPAFTGTRTVRTSSALM